jgi:hypothetical protein
MSQPKDARNYWRKVAAVRSELPAQPWHYAISLGDDTGGVPGVVAPMLHETAARAIAEGRFRIATTEEVSAFLEDEKRKAKEIQAAESKRLRYDLFARPSAPPPPPAETK